LFPESIDDYSTVILGYPNYWGTMPMPVWTFLEHFDFSGKTILPFCTHEAAIWAAVKQIFGNSVPVSPFRRVLPSGEAV
jgi:flavodoxin